MNIKIMDSAIGLLVISLSLSHTHTHTPTPQRQSGHFVDWSALGRLHYSSIKMTVKWWQNTWTGCVEYIQSIHLVNATPVWCSTSKENVSGPKSLIKYTHGEIGLPSFNWIIIIIDTPSLGAEQNQLPCGFTRTSSGNCPETETCMGRACHMPRQPLWNQSSGHLRELVS